MLLGFLAGLYVGWLSGAWYSAWITSLYSKPYPDTPLVLREALDIAEGRE
jgi:hypothetical protein